MQTLRTAPILGLASGKLACQKPLKSRKRQTVVITRAEPESPSEASSAGEPEKARPKTAYIDELPEIKRTELSPEMKARLKREYYNLGGAPNTKMGTNWFLWISIVIGTLAVLSYLTGAV